MLTLKVKRTDESKQFPLIAISKDGDVGMDLPAVLPVKSRDEINRLLDYYNSENNIALTEDFIDRISHDMIVINPGERGVIPTGIHLEIPYGYWASIEARSSTSKRMLIVPKGVIDEGYRGELFAVVLNVGREKQIIHHGDRLVQLILHERIVNNFIIQDVEELSESSRGSSGFGSTGLSSQVQK